MKITEKQIASVLALPGPKRYSHFIKVAADQRQVWGLYHDGWALAGKDDGQQVFPLWPAKEYAEKCVAGGWSGYVPQAIELDSVLDELLPSLRERGTVVGVFYTPTDRGVLPSLEQFESDLREELSRIE